MLNIRALLIGSLLLAGQVVAQSITSRITGTVTDSSGASVVGAKVDARNVETNEHSNTRTDADGAYSLLNLKPGGYELEINAPGFKRYVRRGIGLQLEQETRLNVSLEVGQIDQAVTVEANVPALETTSSTIGAVVNNRAILNLPLDTRNVFSLIYLTPGVSGSIGNNHNSLSYSVNGSRTSLMENMVDGVPAGHPTVQGHTGISVFPSLDAIGEVKVGAENYSAEYG